MTEQTDAAEVDEFEPLRQSLRWHFACHADEPDKSYASLGIENAERIVRQTIAAREAAAEVRGAQAALLMAAIEVRVVRENGLPEGVDSHPTSEAFEDWLRARAARAAAAAAGGGGEA